MHSPFNNLTAVWCAGLSRIEADMMPEQKHAAIQRLRREGRVVAMVGDGVDDIPALAAADIGIAIGMDVAVQSAGDVARLRLTCDQCAALAPGKTIGEGCSAYDELTVHTFLRMLRGRAHIPILTW